MDFALTQEHKMVVDMVRKFGAEAIPVIREYDRKHEPAPLLPRMAELGILGVGIPVKYGGQGLDYISLGLVCEELEYADSTLRVVMAVHMGLCAQTIFHWGTEEQKQKFLVPLAKGEKIGCGAFTEPGHGSDFAHIQMSARREGDYYILNGEKMWISLATLADYAIVTARTNPEAEKPHRGLSTFIVDLHSPGIKRGDIKGKLGVRAGSTGWIAFQDVKVPVENRLGEEGEGFKITMSAFDRGRYTVASGAVGLIRAALDASVRYARERETFGVPIGQHQLIKQKIAHMARDYEMGRLLYLEAGWQMNHGIRATRITSMAKWFATEAALQAANDAIQIHGAYGFSDEYDVERFFRNARGSVIYEGSSEIHTLIQADYALGYRKDKPLRIELPPYDPEEWQE
ncbi:MAG TPA: butyryl-CoA dehydrogenase [Chloroflexi bacterium]|nr:butyryl-CoA dehydrogenase [Chloroflexota bacterium]